ncbi:MAG: cytidylate kinase-like family protein [Lachnospiraceae bacterium]|nr:cytidylate kinase-like family protein [Lachnospiraceae bacterium]
MNYVITIARGFGSGGRSIGEAVGKLLGINCYEKEILMMASEESCIHETLFAEVDEKLRGGYIRNKLRSIPKNTLVTPMSKEFTSDNNLFNIQRKILNDLAKEESYVVVGKCADSVLEIGTPMLKVFVNAPQKKRIRTICNRLEVSETEAEKMILQTDKYRADYYKYYTGGKNWRDPLNYDLFLNSGVFSVDKCAEIIVNAFETKYRS